MKTLMAAALPLAIGCLVAPYTTAHEAGDIILRAGAVTVAPNDDSDPIRLPTDPATVLPGGVGVGSDTQLSLIGAYMVTDQWAVEILAATPFEHDIDVGDLGIDAGTIKHLPPTVSMQWYPRGGQSGWQPYVGLGLNYTYIFDEEIDPALEGALGSVIGANNARLDLDDSFGYSAQVGVDIPINDRWMINAGVWYMNIETTADVVTDVGTVSFDVDINPWVYNIGIGYRF
jgi:outer membrane protein